jgi:hypothetical protein
MKKKKEEGETAAKANRNKKQITEKVLSCDLRIESHVG